VTIALRYYHGGVPNLRIGNMILPPTITGAASCSDFGANSVHRRDRVYVCDRKEGAMLFAAGHPSGNGCVYEVEPLGDLTQDPDVTDIDGFSYECERARVLRVFKLTPSLRRAVLEVLFSDELT